MEEQARKEESAIQKNRQRSEVVECLLHIHGPNFECGATWQRMGNGWRCTKASELIPWMVGLNPEQARAALEQRPDWKFQWSEKLCRGVSVRRVG
jgi:hypothetical protein